MQRGGRHGGRDRKLESQGRRDHTSRGKYGGVGEGGEGCAEIVGTGGGQQRAMVRRQELEVTPVAKSAVAATIETAGTRRVSEKRQPFRRRKRERGGQRGR